MNGQLKGETRHVLVDVEGLFNGGMIVAFTSPDGCEYRGALLRASCSSCGQCQRVLTKSISSLANPVTFIHDHPYSDLHKYSKQISTEMPPNLFLHWNSVPQLDSTLSPSSPHKLHSRTIGGKVVENGSPAMVEATLDQPTETYTWPYVMKSSEQRTAKCVARMKLKRQTNNNDNCITPRSRNEKRKECKTRTTKAATRKRSSPAIGGRGESRAKLKDRLDWFEHDGKRPRSLPPLSNFSSKFSLKKLSIPICRIPVRVKKKKIDNVETASSSSGGSLSLSIECSPSASSFVECTLSPPLSPPRLNDFYNTACAMH